MVTTMIDGPMSGTNLGEERDGPLPLLLLFGLPHNNWDLRVGRLDL